MIILFIFSFFAFAAGVVTLVYTPENNSITTAMIQDGAVTSSKLSSTGFSEGDTLVFDGTSWVAVPNSVGIRGDKSTNPALSCSDALSSGMTSSGSTWVDPAGDGSTLKNVYCEQVLDGGGYIMIYNSVLEQGTTYFWKIAKADALTIEKGFPTIRTNYYNGANYLLPSGAMRVMDVIEGIGGREVIALIATAASIDSNLASGTYMHFQSPALVSGDSPTYIHNFEGGWSSYDYDGDTSVSNCAVTYNSVSQHYGSCFYYSLGSDVDAPTLDSSFGPHMDTTKATALGLANDGSSYTRVKRITRFIKW